MTNKSRSNIEQATVADIQKIVEAISSIENPKVVRMDEKINNIEKALIELKTIVQDREDKLIKQIQTMIDPLARKAEVDLRFEKYSEEIAPIKSLANKVNAALFSAVVSLLGIIGVMVVYLLNR